MRPPLFTSTAALVLLTTAVVDAQVLLPTHGGFARREGVFFHVRTGPFSAFTYSAGAYAFGPAYGPIVPWYYGPYGIPVAVNPYPVQPPIVIQNIIPPPPPVPLVGDVPGRGPVIPAEFEAPPARPAPRAARVGPAPVPPPLVAAPAAPRPANRAEADRTADAGRKAFAAGQHGRALELFRRAAAITPEEPSAHFLISQAQFALGKYRKAVEAIAAGMALRADWSEARFQSRDLYAKNPATFDEHMAALRTAVETFPNDASLLFLLGHQLWFDGKPDEARPFILRARAAGMDRTPAPAFVVN